MPSFFPLLATSVAPPLASAFFFYPSHFSFLHLGFSVPNLFDLATFPALIILSGFFFLFYAICLFFYRRYRMSSSEVTQSYGDSFGSIVIVGFVIMYFCFAVWTAFMTVPYTMPCMSPPHPFHLPHGTDFPPVSASSPHGLHFRLLQFLKPEVQPPLKPFSTLQVSNSWFSCTDAPYKPHPLY
jgi:hypothetical protein